MESIDDFIESMFLNKSFLNIFLFRNYKRDTLKWMRTHVCYFKIVLNERLFRLVLFNSRYV